MNIFGFWNKFDRKMKVWLMIGTKVKRFQDCYMKSQYTWSFIISSDPALAWSLRQGRKHTALVLGNLVIGFMI